MKKALLLSLLLMLVILFNSLDVFADALDISDECSYILIDSKTGQVILEHNADRKLRPASITKIMTAIIALENGKLDSAMNVSGRAVNDIGAGGMHVGIEEGETGLTLENLLNVMLIKSANEAANIVAENIAGSKEAFVKEMNEKAVLLGALNTNFVNPCGKDSEKEDKEHLSTARDMATISRYAMTIPKFREIVAKEWYGDMPATNIHQQWGRFRTTNRLLWGETNEFDYKIDSVESKFMVNGMKTGYTSAAGNNAICSAYNYDGMELIAVVMHVMSGNNAVFNYAEKLLRYGFENYTNQNVIDKDKVIKNITVEESNNDEGLDLKTGSRFICALPRDKSKWNIQSKEIINLPVKAPVSQGDVLGYMEFERDGTVLGKVDIVAGKSVDKKKELVEGGAQAGDFNYILMTALIVIAALLFALPRIISNKIHEKDI